MSNMHGSLIEISGSGVFVCGPSGSGKTTLCLHMLRRCRGTDYPAFLIADDQVLLSEDKNGLYGRAPKALDSKVEIYGFGISAFEHTRKTALIKLHIDLVPKKDAIRFWDGQMFSHGEYKMRSLKLEAQNYEPSANAIFAALGLPIWL